MTWWRNPNEAPDSPLTYYTSQAVEDQEIRMAVRTVFDELLGRREAHRVAAEARGFFFVNSVNGFVDVGWVDAKFESAGDWTYTLWLPALNELCLEHPEGADHFVWTARCAIFDAVYDYYYDRYGDDFEITPCKPECYFQTDVQDSPEFIIV